MWKCDNCKSTNVHIKQWVKVNGGEYVDDVSETGNQDKWCPDCETHCSITFKKE